MVATNFSIGAAVLLAARLVSATGNAIVHNQCPYTVYLWSIANTDSPMQTLAANGGQYSETYRVNADGGGVAIKMGSDSNRINVTQFEYTYESDGSALWYDLSNINGYPFEEYGVTVVPTDSSCRSVSCPAGQNLCGQAYNVPTDNFATAECSSTANTVIVLCSGEADTSGSASASASISSAASSISSVASQAASTASLVSSSIFTTATGATSTLAAATSTAKPVHKTHTTTTAAAVENVGTTAAAATTEAPATSEAVVANPYVVVQTTFVTHVVTVEARSAQPTAAKRDAHHEHAHVHAEHVARHHSHPRAFARK